MAIDGERITRKIVFNREQIDSIKTLLNESLLLAMIDWLKLYNLKRWIKGGTWTVEEFAWERNIEIKERGGIRP